MTAIDAFADAQTLALAEKSIAVKYGSYGFDAVGLLAAVDALDTAHFAGLVYGSGFEAQPELLTQLAARLPLIGNSAEVVAALKNPVRFFAVLQQLHIPYPYICDAIGADDSSDYLLKFGGGSGGMHIRAVNSQHFPAAAQYYYQQKIAGRSVSLLFLADRHVVEVIGFNEQWLNPSSAAPYRYGGAVGHAELPEEVKAQLADAAEKITQAFGLVGLNSLDAIAMVDNQVFVLEINPRLSATVDLYHFLQPDLLQRHVQACLEESSLNQHLAEPLQIRSKAHAIVYASAEMELKAPLPWPEWVVDTPPDEQLPIKMLPGDPVCTVIAYADHAVAAKKLVQCRVEIVENLLQSIH